MMIVIVGGGKVGYYLAKTLAPEKHRLVLLEADAQQCAKIAGELNKLNIELICGDGTEINALQDAGIEHADILIAVTGYDQNNLVACQLARSYFGVPRTVARVNNPKNIEVFKRLGVDSVVSSTAHIANIISQEVDWAGINQMLSSKVGDVRMKDIPVGDASAAAGKLVSQLDLPAGTVLMSIIRGKEAFIPNGQTLIQAGDSVIALSHESNLGLLSDYFTASGGGEQHE
jgi:trk system potassium uptake protein TrkA